MPQDWTLAACIIGGAVGVGFVLKKAGLLDKGHREPFDDKSHQDLDVLSMHGPIRQMYEDWINIRHCGGVGMFRAKWNEQLEKMKIKDVKDLLPKFSQIWAALHPSLWADLRDRLDTLEHPSGRADHTEVVLTDLPGMAAQRRDNLKLLLTRSYAPELVKPLSFLAAC